MTKPIEELTYPDGTMQAALSDIRGRNAGNVPAQIAGEKWVMVEYEIMINGGGGYYMAGERQQKKAQEAMNDYRKAKGLR